VKKLIAILGMIAILSPPFVAQAGDQTVPNGVQRVGAPLTETPDAGSFFSYNDVNVAVVDTGIDTEHPDLNVVGGVDCSPKQEMSMYGSTTFFTQDVKDATNPFGPIEIAPDAPGWQDGMGHGTHVSGTIGALDNDLGVVGVAPGVNLYAVRVLDSGGSGTVESIICGLEWIVRNNGRIGFDVVNMSLGLHTDEKLYFGPCHTNYSADPRYVGDEGLLAIQEAICNVTDIGIPVVVAAGNDDGDAGANFPATLHNVITVSNFSDFDGKPGGLSENVACPALGGWDDALWTHWNGTPNREMSSSNGYDVDFAAPGTCILSTLPGQWGNHGGAYGTATGTSMAAPHVTGLIALYKSARPDSSLQDVREWLLSSATPQDASFADTDAFPEPLAHYRPPAKPTPEACQHCP
jgi:subtilisin family serine protease